MRLYDGTLSMWRNIFRRRVLFLGGPCDGMKDPLPLPDRTDWPMWICRQSPGASWSHYRHVGEHRYRYVGECAYIDHNGLGPEDQGPHHCCGASHE